MGKGFWRVRLCVCMGLALLGACTPAMSPPDQADVPLPAERWVFRHKVQVVISDRVAAQSFDGMMCYDRAAQRIQVVGLGGFGLPLFDLLVERERTTVVSMHPALEAIPGVVERIAATVRHVWFDCLENITQTRSVEQAEWRCTVSEQHLHGWPVTVRYENRIHSYVVTVRLVQADREGGL